ncbi:pyridoxamine 5'-phosphate oxidase family protein [Paenibacillus glycinis]|uniref:Pyridoxamine 5'-phosphate oxidase n=1 Tax=Paenibacillus glycinis TaxID=2697035 RepID=A0ABW9XPY4_9BACL|nr:pyridoxamine 5'-phosphate oxidase family protein [Paenibacillus glycinis]NBD24705.1 pyridoxamine 5'-phosphate oxidase [Paenibacillus glycinis]
MQDVYHEGERMVQNRSGEGAIAAQHAKMISSSFSKGIVNFLQTQQFAVLSSTDGEGKVWTTFLTGEPGFVEVLDEQRALIRAELIADDPLASATGEQKQVGLLIIDTKRRIRLRINGTAAMERERFIVTAHQIYGNCPKYIQKRTLRPEQDVHRLLKSERRAKELNTLQTDWIAQADTFYIGSTNDRGEMDASHRGGNPGFVRVEDAHTLLFPDYFGNSMFNTLGNIQSNPLSGLLFIDYEHGHSLHLTGASAIIWDEATIAAFPGADRVVRFEIRDVVQLDNATAMRWEDTEMSPYNPLG